MISNLQANQKKIFLTHEAVCEITQTKEPVAGCINDFPFSELGIEPTQRIFSL